MLYYDSITRIVPSGFEPDQIGYYTFSPESRALLADIQELRSSGFIREEAPGNNVVSQIADEFFDFAIENLRDPIRRSEMMPALSRHKEFYTIHRAKIDPVLVKVLEELHLARRNATDPNNDWDIERVTGGLYMLFLASRMAGQRQLVSDSSIYQSLMYAPLKTSQKLARHDDREFRLATAVLHTLVPENLEYIKLDVLLRLRSELSDQRRRFQDRIASLAKDLQSLEGKVEIEGFIERQKQTFEDEYAIFKDKLRGANLSLANGLFSLSVPAYITAQWGLGVTSHPVVFAAGAVAASISAVRYVLDRKVARATSPYTYLLNVSKRIDAQTMAKDIVQLNLNAHYDDDEDPRIYLWAAPKVGPKGNPFDGSGVV